ARIAETRVHVRLPAHAEERGRPAEVTDQREGGLGAGLRLRSPCGVHADRRELHQRAEVLLEEGPVAFGPGTSVVVHGRSASTSAAVNARPTDPSGSRSGS